MRVEQLDAAADGSSHDAADHIDGPGESDSNVRRTGINTEGEGTRNRVKGRSTLLWRATNGVTSDCGHIDGYEAGNWLAARTFLHKFKLDWLHGKPMMNK
jgi:hypothetical protein